MAQSDREPIRLLCRVVCCVATLAASLTMVLGHGAPAAQASTYCHATMGGTFVPANGWASTWDIKRTEQVLTDMQAIGINSAILQNSVDLVTQKAWYPQAWYPQGNNAVGYLAYETTVHHMGLILGLADSGFADWAAHQGDAAWLHNRVLLDEAIADQLYAYVGPFFQAWYIPEEVDDYAVFYNSPTLTSYFTELTTYLHTHDGNKGVVTAPFYQNFQTPTAFATGLRKVLGTVDAVNVQDGATELGGRSPAQITSLFQALSTAFTGGPMVWDSPDLYGPNGGPMAPATLQANLNAVCGAAAFITGWSYPSQLDSPYAKTPQYLAYQSYRASS